MNKKESIIPILLDGDKNPFYITEYHYEKILCNFNLGLVDKYFVGYISDAILLSENAIFENEDLMYKFEMFSEI